MTPAPTTTRPANVEALARAARVADFRYSDHVRRATQCACATGGLCEQGKALLAEADDADKRVMTAEGRW